MSIPYSECVQVQNRQDRQHVNEILMDIVDIIGLGHVMDWSSLTPLLPSECWSVLAELPQLKRHSHSRFENTKPQFTLATPKESQSPVPSEGKVPKGSVDSGVSDGTSGYRGSSTLLTESSETKQSNPLYVYDYSWSNEPATPHKLKSNPELNKIDNKEKRLSMFEFTASILDDVFENNSVSKFLKGHNRKLQDHQKTPPNSPINQKSYQLNPNNLNDFYLGQAERIRESPDYENRKECLVEGVVCGVERLLSQKENAAEIALGSLCPALYALMSDGLKTNIDTPFGPINNSVWQVVEASAHQAWVSYMRTRESVLRKHYNPESVLLQASQGQALSRALTDRIISGLRPLSQVHFSLDLLYETKLLHTSLLQLMRVPVSPTGSTDSESALVRKIVQSLRCCGLTNQTCSSCEQNYDLGDRRRRGVRPRSCVEVIGSSGESVGSSRKRWSGVAMGSRLASAFDSLAEGSSPISSPEEGGQNHGTGKFKSLQRKWELLSNKTSLCSPPASPVKTNVNTTGTTVKSRIPRPVTSPVRPDVGRSRIPRASRADGLDRITGVGRPSSLPQSRGPPPTHPSTTRRAASSSSTRPSTKKTQPANNRFVVTLTHRLPSDSGHLAFNEGERLRLVLEVDDTWLLCCRGDRKGLVPRSAVI